MELNDVVSLYRDWCKVPSPVSATVVNVNPDIVQVYAESTQKDLTKSENTRFTTTYMLDAKTMNPIAKSQPVEVTSEQLNRITTTGNMKAVIRKLPNKKGLDNHYLEVWTGACKVINIDLNILDVHGKPYEDGQFGMLAWSNNNNKLIYVAEKKRPKAESFFVHAPDPSTIELKSPKKDTIKGEEYAYIEDWGEALVKKHQSVICCLELQSETVTVFNGFPDYVSLGQAIWLPDDSGIVCVGWWQEPQRLGLIYCSNRRSALFHLNFETGEVQVIGNQDKAVHSPRFSPDGEKLIYLESDVGGPHFKGSKLMLCSWPQKELSNIVDVVGHAEGHAFPGIFVSALQQRVWSKDNGRIVLNSQWRSKQELICIDVETSRVTCLTTTFGCWRILDIWDDIIVATCSSPNMKPMLVSARLPGNNEKIQWVKLETDNPELSSIHWNIVPLRPSPENVHPIYKELDYEVILVKPSFKSKEEMAASPVIVWPHGGPHIAYPAGFQLYAALFAQLGYFCILVNYRGSSGFGEDSIKSLLGRIGMQDVADCQQAVEHVIRVEGLTQNAAVVFGGSHGGFLAAHLIGQYPDFYKACVCRNPVVDLSSKHGVTDIPDWGWVEAGFQYNYLRTVDPDVLKSMWECSPMKYVNNVKTPTLLLMGSLDKRVPPSQSLQFYYSLKARNVPVHMYVYEDNHALAKVDVEADAFVNTVKWFRKHAKNDRPTN